MRTLTSLSSELNTKLLRQTINAQASGPYRRLYVSCISRAPETKDLGVSFSFRVCACWWWTTVGIDYVVILTSANEKQTIKSFSFCGKKSNITTKNVLAQQQKSCKNMTGQKTTLKISTKLLYTSTKFFHIRISMLLKHCTKMITKVYTFT